MSLFLKNVFLFLFYQSGKTSKTFKPRKNVTEANESHNFDVSKHASTTLGSGNLRLAVTLPEGEDINEWVAVNSEFLSSLLLKHISYLILQVCFILILVLVKTYLVVNLGV